MTWKNWLLKKVTFTAIAFAVLYLAASTFNLAPQSMKDTVNWFGSNFQTIAFAVCFLVACYTATQIINRKKQKTSPG